MLASTLFTLLAAGLTTAVPLDRRDVSLDAAATAEAQQRDNTATRAFTATTITTSDGRCLSVDPFSGDFRENLTPVVAVTCNGSKNQTWDVLTAGKHNNVAGQALIVSSLTNACLNFDPRRAQGDQVNLFSCGGRADGGGLVANSQLFAFAGGNGPLALTPQNGNNAICLTINGNNRLDQTACKGASSASGLELFTFGGKAAAAPPQAVETTKAAAATTAADCVATTVTETVTVTVTTDSGAAKTNVAVVQTTSTAAAAAATAATSTAAAATSTAATATTIKVSGAGGVLNPTAVAEAQQRDNTATRAATGVPIKDSTGQCLSVDATAGDFRENLIPIQIKDCDGSDGQKWDFVTKGVHNDQPNQTLIVSSLTNGCMNFDDRRAPGDQVNLFSCGGRGDGSGGVQNGQLFPFTSANLTAPYVLTPENSNGKVCFVNDNGRLGNVACSPANPSANQLFTIGSGSGSVAQTKSISTATAISTTATTTSTVAAAAITTVDAAAAATTTAATATTATVIKVSGAGVVLNPTAVAESQQRDNTATRAATGAQIKDSAGQCLSVDATAGDFRENLIPVQLKPCDGSDGQKWDFLTKGVHNNQPNSALIVSSLTQGCLNFDDRRQPGDQVNLFSCGGRADGSGQVQNAQLFPFTAANLTAPYVLTPESSNGKVCLVDDNGRLGNAACNAASPAANEFFTIVA